MMSAMLWPFMVKQSSRTDSVLVIDGDRSHRRLIATVLQHAGFQVTAVEDASSASELLQRFKYAAIVRELNLAPAQRDRALESLLSTDAEVLRRTVITTTAVARALKLLGSNRVFAVVSKPFDIDAFVDAVARCARESRDRFPTDRQVPVNLDAVRRFVSTVPSLQRLLSAPVHSGPEAALRAEMRHTIGDLSVGLDDAARVEASPARAAVLRAASTVAAQLAMQPARERLSTQRDH